MINKPLVLATLDRIENDLDHWDQEQYITACGTTMCFGGWALHLSGYKPTTVVPWSSIVGFEDPMSREPITNGADIEIEAMEVLGFDDEMAWQVFHWHPEDHLPTDMNYEVCATKAEQFAAFKEHVLAVIGAEGN